MTTIHAIKKYKLCPSCNKEYPATDSYFYQSSNQEDGLYHTCMDCSRKRRREFRDRNRERNKGIVLVSGTKTCANCKYELSVEEFGILRAEYDGLRRVCKKCELEKRRTPEGVAQQRIRSYSFKDKRVGLDCTITVQWFLDNITGKQCTYCGIFDDVGCDRIDNSIGHTPDNCVPACRECNRARSDYFSFDEMVKFIGPAISCSKLSRGGVS